MFAVLRLFSSFDRCIWLNKLFKKIKMWFLDYPCFRLSGTGSVPSGPDNRGSTVFVKSLGIPINFNRL